MTTPAHQRARAIVNEFQLWIASTKSSYSAIVADDDDKLVELIAAALEEEIDECIAVCWGEKVDADDTKESSDYAYNQAIDDCIASLKQRKGAR